MRAVNGGAIGRRGARSMIAHPSLLDRGVRQGTHWNHSGAVGLSKGVVFTTTKKASKARPWFAYQDSV